jgi:hypothetical protein
MFVPHKTGIGSICKGNEKCGKRWDSYGKGIRIGTSGGDKEQYPALLGVFGWSGSLKKSFRREFWGERDRDATF